VTDVSKSALSGGGFKAGSTALQLTVTSATGTAITSFSSPLVLHFPAPATGTPEYSQDGGTWVAIPRLATPQLPAGQRDGYYLNADGSIDVYTLHATYFALLAPAAPTGLVAKLKGGTLTLSWTAAASGASAVDHYLVTLNGTKIATIPGTTAATHAFVPHAAGQYQLVAVDARGVQTTGTETVGVSPKARPKLAPRTVPRWAWNLLGWQEHPNGARPSAAPRHLPRWYAAWKAWRLDPHMLLSA
jgi:hypothetical protein